MVKYRLVNRKTQTMRGKFMTRDAARAAKRSTPRPENWRILNTRSETYVR